MERIFTPGYQDKEIASIGVAAGSSESVTVTIKPTYNTAAGQYTINCAAISAKDMLTADLTINITGTFKLNLTTDTGQLNADAYAGKETAVTLVVQNTGSADISNIQLSAQAPNNWSVTFDPMGISSLAAGESKNVVAYIKAAENAIAGDYVVNFSAYSAEAQGQSSFRVAVKTSTIWGVVGITIILVLAIGLTVVFMKFGRR